MNECQESQSNCITLLASSIGRDELRSFKTHLYEQQKQLRSALNRAHEEIRALDTLDRGDVIDDCLGNSSREALFKSYTQSWTQLRKVDAALERIESGDFGTCSICGGEIGIKRLRALPWASNCIECQAESEQLRSRT